LSRNDALRLERELQARYSDHPKWRNGDKFYRGSYGGSQSNGDQLSHGVYICWW
jgi:hypothetical protein